MRTQGSLKLKAMTHFNSPLIFAYFFSATSDAFLAKSVNSIT